MTTLFPSPRPRHRLALLLVDVNRSFFDPAGEFYFPASADLVRPLRRLLEAARAGGRLVIHAREGHRPGLHDYEGRKLPAHTASGGRDAESLPGFEELPEEPVVVKRRYSAFVGTDLGLLLAEQDVRRLLVAGVKTNVCVRATVQDAFAYGFRPCVVRQAVGSNRPHLHAASLEDIERYLGEVVELDTALAWLEGEAPDA